MYNRRLRLAVSLFALVAANAAAQVPLLINCQGRVTVVGAGFTGTGQFKFALVNTTGFTPYWSNGDASTANSHPNPRRA